MLYEPTARQNTVVTHATACSSVVMPRVTGFRDPAGGADVWLLIAKRATPATTTAATLPTVMASRGRPLKACNML